jgi:acyl carrier protein
LNEIHDRIDRQSLLNGHASEMKVGLFYGELRNRGLEYGARFANVRELWIGAPGSGEAFGRITDNVAAALKTRDPFINTILLDGCLHVFGAAIGTLDVIKPTGAFVPASIQSIKLWKELPSQVWSHVKVSANNNGSAALANVRVFSDEGELLAEFINLELRSTLSLMPTNQSGSAVNAKRIVLENPAYQSREHLVKHLRPMMKHERILELSKWLTAEIKDTMGQAAEGLTLDNLPPSTAFLEIGLDSLLVTELQRRIQEKLEFRFKPMQGLDYQSLETMAEFIHDEVLSKDLEAQAARITDGG